MSPFTLPSDDTAGLDAADERMAPILVVEDSEAMRAVILWALEDEGLPVLGVVNGSDALAQARRQRPSLVVLDMGLPDMDGVAVADALRASYGRELPILVVTADGRAAQKAQRVGAFAWLHKPFEVDNLVSRVHRALAGDAGQQPRLAD